MGSGPVSCGAAEKGAEIAVWFGKRKVYDEMKMKMNHA